jgi:hypothetical protein
MPRNVPRRNENFTKPITDSLPKLCRNFTSACRVIGDPGAGLFPGK